MLLGPLRIVKVFPLPGWPNTVEFSNFHHMPLQYSYCAFPNTRILNFKSQLTFAFLAAVNQCREPLRKQRVQNVMVCDWWISIRWVCFCVSGFVACVSNYE